MMSNSDDIERAIDWLGWIEVNVGAGDDKLYNTRKHGYLELTTFNPTKSLDNMALVEAEIDKRGLTKKYELYLYAASGDGHTFTAPANTRFKSFIAMLNLLENKP